MPGSDLIILTTIYALGRFGFNILEDCRRLDVIEIEHSLSVLAQPLGSLKGNTVDVVYQPEYVMKNTFDGRAVLRFDAVNQHLGPEQLTTNLSVLMTEQYGYERSI